MVRRLLVGSANYILGPFGPDCDLRRWGLALASRGGKGAKRRAAVAVARTALGVLLGEPVPERLALGEDLDAALPALEDGPQKLVEKASRQRPEIQALEGITRAYDDSIRANEGARLPHLALVAGLDYQNPNQRIFPQKEEFAATWDISAVLSWSPNDLMDASRRAAETYADLEKTRADLAGLRDALELEVTRACEEYGSARDAMESAQAGIRAAEESFRVRREQFRAGSAVATEVIDAESELRRARLELVNASIDLRIARARLDRAVGRKIP
jgi:outer membrane protein TolC